MRVTKDSKCNLAGEHSKQKINIIDNTVIRKPFKIFNCPRNIHANEKGCSDKILSTKIEEISNKQPKVYNTRATVFKPHVSSDKDDIHDSFSDDNSFDVDYKFPSDTDSSSSSNKHI